MEQYSSFAKVYDYFMDTVPYKEWSSYITDILSNYGIHDGLVLDMACGTGKLTRLLSKAGYDLIGLDASVEMLDEAKKNTLDSNILYINQDMREMDLFGTVRAVVCAFDSINYILSEDDLLQVFRNVNNFLDPDGLFIFDMNTEYKYRELIGNTTIAENREDAAFIWDNFYSVDDKLNEYNMVFFTREGDLFKRTTETHYQKAYDIEEMKSLINESGLLLECVFDAYTTDAPRDDSERVLFICKEQGKG